MTAPRICVSAERVLGLAEPPEVSRLRRLGYAFTLLRAAASLSEKQRALAGCEVLISIRPSSRDSYLWLRLAAGMGVSLLVLSTKTAASPFPLGAKVFARLDALVAELATLAGGDGPVGRYISPELVRSFNPCQESQDYFEGRYPAGRHSRFWTLDEQLEVLKDGGAPWLQSMFDRGVLRQWPMNGVDLAGADMAGLRLIDGELRGADLTGAKLDGCQLLKTDLSGAKLGNASLTRSVLQDCNATGAHLAAADLSACHIRAVTFDDADLGGAKLEKSHLRRGTAIRASFAAAAMAGVTLRDCDLSGANFEGATLDNSQFLSCRLEEASFVGASLAGAVFFESSLSGDKAASVASDAAYVKAPAA